MKQILAPALNVVGNRWTISVLGLVLVAVLIWVLGPPFGYGAVRPLESPMARLIAIIALVFGWGVYNIVKISRARANNRQILDGLVAAPDRAAAPASAGASDEVEVLRGRFKEAMASLRDARIGRRFGKQYLYQLPWYLIIGPPGAGKTTAIKNAGLKFPLEDKFGADAVRGVGGTRNCDWWFTDEAVILDTAGRYTTQDSDAEADREAWRGFLSLLRKHRRRRPVDGVMVAFSLPDIIRASQEERQAHAHAVRKRLAEVYDDLKVRAPIYVVFTKCDLLSGFVEFFDALGAEDRRQVWGVTFDPDDSQSGRGAAAFGSAFDGLYGRLEGMTADRLAQERDMERRARILGFPQQFAAGKAPIEAFLADVFAGNAYDSGALLRGVYFSSGTQEGAPFDRLIGSVASAFGLERAPAAMISGAGRSYFLARLLKDVVFKESDLVGATDFYTRHRREIQRAAYGATAAAAVLLIAGWTASFMQNRALVAEVNAATSAFEEKVQAFEASEGDVADIVAYLDGLRALPGGYEDRGRRLVPALMGLGLYQGGKLGAGAVRAYEEALQNQLAPLVGRRLEDQITARLGARVSGDDSEFLYQALKTYLMLGWPSRLDPAHATLWVQTDWTRLLAGEADEATVASFNAHAEALFNLSPPAKIPLSEETVLAAREVLRDVSAAERAFGQIRNGPAARDLLPWRLSDYLSTADARYFRRKDGAPLSQGVDGLFTLDGYRDFFRKQGRAEARAAIDETWVLGLTDEERAAIDLDDVYGEIEVYYFESYRDAWSAYIDQLDIAPFQGEADAVNAIKTLSAERSPIKTALAALAQQTDLSGAVQPAGGAAEKALSAGGQRIVELLGADAPRPVNDDRPARPSDVVAARFQDLHDLVRRDDGAGVDRALQSLNDLHAYVFDLSLSDADAARAAMTGSRVTEMIRLEALRQPKPLSAWMISLARESSAISMQRARGGLSAAWATSAAPFCEQAIAGRYPVARGAASDIRLNDFADFFGAGGRVDAFFQTYLARYVDVSATPWRLKSVDGATLDISPETLLMFENAAKIRAAFFPRGGDAPYLDFTLQRSVLQEHVGEAALRVGGNEALIDTHGRAEARRIVWPPDSGDYTARLELTHIATGVAGVVSADGPWAPLRLIDKGVLQRRGGAADRFQASFTREGMTIVFDLEASSVTNPFLLDALRAFRCVSTL
ncbi:MAG: type VI secretion system membrane subunit TssM [Pseudomonadota bacterium]